MLDAPELREALLNSHKMLSIHLDRLIACCEALPEDVSHREELRKIHQSLALVAADIKRNLAYD